MFCREIVDRRSCGDLAWTCRYHLMRQQHAHQPSRCPCARLQSDMLRLPPFPHRLRFNACYASADNSKGYLNFLRVAG